MYQRDTLVIAAEKYNNLLLFHAFFRFLRLAQKFQQKKLYGVGPYDSYYSVRMDAAVKMSRMKYRELIGKP